MKVLATSRLRGLAILLAVVALVLACFTQEQEAFAAPACTPASQCCKICEGGQACGNSCISRSKQCHKGRGCSCNASEVCP